MGCDDSHRTGMPTCHNWWIKGANGGGKADIHAWKKVAEVHGNRTHPGRF